MKNLIARWYAAGKWDADQVNAAVAKGWITDTDAAEIIGFTEAK
jgi:hypothetical protein